MEKEIQTATPQKTEEIQVFKELGLSNQVAMREIEAVMDGMPYYPVTMKQLDKLFGMQWIAFLTMLHNWGVRFRSRPIVTSVFWMILAIPPVTITIGAVFGGNAWAACMGNIILLFAAMLWDMEIKDVRGTLEAKVEIEGINSTSVKIPYGAALRYKEAKEKGIFDGFVVAYPNVVAIERPLSRDPAILGYKSGGEGWRDERGRSYFMVVYWDIEKDRERAIRKIKDFRKFKV